MNQKRFQEIKRNFYELHPDDQTEDMTDLIAEVERLRAEVDTLESKDIDAYLARELELDRLRANQKRLVEAASTALEYFRIEGQYQPEERGFARYEAEKRLKAAIESASMGDCRECGEPAYLKGNGLCEGCWSEQ